VEAPEAAAQLAQLRHEYERKVKDAHAAAFREGEAAGRSRAMAEVQPVIERLVRTIEEIGQLRHRLRREAEADTIKLSLAIAHRVLRRELAMDPDAMRGLVTAAVEKLHSQEISRVKVHPAHAPQIAALLRGGPLHINAEVTADASLPPGGVVFETNHGNLDASIDSQLQEIERGLTDRLRGNA
jgi:flagellar assembly protein FliH